MLLKLLAVSVAHPHFRLRNKPVYRLAHICTPLMQSTDFARDVPLAMFLSIRLALPEVIRHPHLHLPLSQ